MAQVELYGTRWCPYTAEARSALEWRGVAFIEYDVEADIDACRRLLQLTGGRRTIPVLVQDGQVIAIGWQGRGCTF